MLVNKDSLKARAVFAGVSLFLLSCFDLSAQTGRSQTAQAEPNAPEVLQSFVPSSIDHSIDPCRDFYKYACGGWIAKHPVPADQERIWVGGQMNDRNFYLLYQQLKQAAAAPETPLQRQYGAFFAACMNVDQADVLGIKPLLPTLAAIQAVKEKREIAGLLADRRYFAHGFLMLTVEQDEKDSQKQLPTLRQAGLTLPTPDYYLASTAQQKTILAQYTGFLETLFHLLGDTPAEASTESRSVLDLETALARGSMSRVDMRDPTKIYHPMGMQALQELAPGFTWQAYFTGVGAPSFSVVNVEQPIYLATMAKVISTVSLPELKSYLRLHAAVSVAPYLSKPFEQASFRFFNTALRGQTEEQARWKRCTVLSNMELSDAVGQDWVRRNFSFESKAGAEEIIANVRSALRDEIEDLPWMSPEAKQEALRKLSAMREKIGYPGKWRDYSSLIVDPANFLADLQAAEHLNRQYLLGRIGKPVEEAVFYWTAPEADGNYNEHLNDLEFPAGILQAPRYSPLADLAVNYGGFGTFVGHEITHGFDDVGSRYDEHGNLREWFTSADRTAFNHMTSCEVKEYSSFDAAPGLKLDGALSVGENTADNGGMRIAYRAYQQVAAQQPAVERHRERDGFTPDQQFFLSFAQSWCETRTPEYQRVRGQTDPHPPGEFRVNGTVQNFPQFGEAFACHVGQPMMPADACHVW